MSGIPVPAWRDPGRMLGIVRSWLAAQSREFRPTSTERAIERRVPTAQGNALVRVLVVDDNPVNLMLMSALMESRGLSPLLAADGAEAVALACELHFDLILMDLQMPVLDGLAATLAIRHFEREFARPAVPVVAYSSNCPDKAALAQHGFDGSLSKPSGVQDLEDCLVQWCPGYRPVAPAHDAAHNGSGMQRAPWSSGSASLR